MRASTKNPAPLAAGPASENFSLSAESGSQIKADGYRMALAGDALADVSRIIAVNALAAEGAARRGDEAEAVARLRAVAAALDEARDVYALAMGRRSP